MKLLNAALICLSMLGAGAQAQTFYLEEDTGTVWMTDGGFFFGGNIQAEWRADGSILRHDDVFSPFRYFSSQALTEQRPMHPGYMDGKFAIFTHYRGFYSRDDQGRWQANELFADGRFGCVDDNNSTPCHLLSFEYDGRGIPFVVVLNNDMGFSRFYYEDGTFRAPSGVERVMEEDINTSFILQNGSWSDDLNFLVASGFFFGGNELPYYVANADGVREYKIAVDGWLPFNQNFFFIGERLLSFVIGSETLPDDTFRYRAQLMEYSGYREAEPTPTMVHSFEVGQEFMTFVGSSGPKLIYSLQQTLRAFDVLTGEDSLIVDGCSGAMALQTIGKGDLWVGGCAEKVVALRDGVVATELALSGAFTSGSVLKGVDEGYDVVFQMSDGSLERHRAGQSTLRTRVSPIPFSGSLGRVWEERDTICGSTAAQVVCQTAGIWQGVDGHSLKSVLQVLNIGGVWWGLDRHESNFRLQWLSEEGTWQVMRSFPVVEGTFDPRLILVGDQGVGVDFPAGDTYVFDGEAYAPAYPRDRSSGARSYPAIDSSGQMLDLCQVDEGLFPCRIAADGTKSIFADVPISDPYSTAYAHPLRYGFLANWNYIYYVVRGDSVIRLADLFGEFSGPNGEMASVEWTDIGHGELLARVSRSEGDDGQSVNSFFEFDGRTLREVSLSTTRHVQIADMFGGSITIPGDSGFASVSMMKRIWQGRDGIYRRADSRGGDVIEYGTSAVDAIYMRQSVAPNYVLASELFRDSALAGTADGLWSCRTANSPVISQDVSVLLRNDSCKRLKTWPDVHRIVRVGDGIAVQQGARVWLSQDAELAEFLVLTESATRQSLALAGDDLVWGEGEAQGFFDWSSRTVQAIRPLPEGLEKITRFGVNYLCADGASFYYGSLGWSRLMEAGACLDVVETDELAYLATATRLMVCDRDGTCSAGAELPLSFMGDSRLGQIEGDIVYAAGSQLFRVDDSLSFVDVTPQFADGSLILAGTSSIGSNGVSMLGGGVAVYPQGLSGEVRHLRLD